MPRSWPSTETADARLEVIELDRAVPEERIDRGRAGRPGWKVWAVAALAIAGGAFFLPGAEQGVDHTVAIDSLPEPEVATTATTLSPSSVAVIGEETFPLIPVTGLDGYARITTPMAFGGRYWVAAAASFGSERVMILSSEDGASWSQQAELPHQGETIRVDDMGVYGNVLMALGVGAAGPPIPDTLGGNPEAVLLWKTTDGVDWRAELVKADDGRHRYFDLDLVTGDHAVLIGGYHDLALGPLLEEALPAEVVSELAQGNLSYMMSSQTATTSTLVVVAPPGIEVLTVEIPFVSSASGPPGWLFRSETLAAWQRMETDFPTGDTMAAWPGHGFVATSFGGETIFSPDGREWGPAEDLPNAHYQQWNGRLVGKSWTANQIHVESTTGLARIVLPAEFGHRGRFVGPNPWLSDFVTGPGGLAAVRSTYDRYTPPPVSITSGEITIKLTDGILRATRDDRVRWVIALGPQSVPGTYDPVARTVTVTPLGTTESLILDLDDLQAFWEPVVTGGRHEIFVSADGLVWHQGQAALISERVSLIGGVADTFLIGISREYQPGQFPPIMTVYRTGPVG